MLGGLNLCKAYPPPLKKVSQGCYECPRLQCFILPRSSVLSVRVLDLVSPPWILFQTLIIILSSHQSSMAYNERYLSKL